METVIGSTVIENFLIFDRIHYSIIDCKIIAEDNFTGFFDICGRNQQTGLILDFKCLIGVICSSLTIGKTVDCSLYKGIVVNRGKGFEGLGVSIDNGENELSIVRLSFRGF